ncbi:MAG: BON domain-containing protein [Alphaproteobacteria bacterium]
MKKNIIITICFLTTINLFFGYNNVQAADNQHFVKDTALTTSLKSKYLADEKLKGLSIHVETHEGQVTLTGHVANEEEAERAKEIAKNTNGVKKVISKLELENEHQKNHLFADSTLTAAIKAKYIADEKLKSLFIHVVTHEGKVTLTGKVGDKEEAERAEEIAKNTNGVKEVISKLEIVK